QIEEAPGVKDEDGHNDKHAQPIQVIAARRRRFLRAHHESPFHSFSSARQTPSILAGCEDDVNRISHWAVGRIYWGSRRPLHRHKPAEPPLQSRFARSCRWLALPPPQA